MGAARRAVFGGVAWQSRQSLEAIALRCQFHLQPRAKVPFDGGNAQSYVPKEEMKKEVSAKIRSIFIAPDLVTAQEQLRLAVKEYERTAPKLSLWLEKAIPEGLSVFALPESQRRFLRTSNGLGRAIALGRLSWSG